MPFQFSYCIWRYSLWNFNGWLPNWIWRMSRTIKFIGIILWSSFISTPWMDTTVSLILAIIIGTLAIWLSTDDTINHFRINSKVLYPPSIRSISIHGCRIWIFVIIIMRSQIRLIFICHELIPMERTPFSTCLTISHLFLTFVDIVTSLLYTVWTLYCVGITEGTRHHTMCECIHARLGLFSPLHSLLEVSGVELVDDAHVNLLFNHPEF